MLGCPKVPSLTPQKCKGPSHEKNAALQTLDNKGHVGPFRALVPGPSRRFASKHMRHCHIFHFVDLCDHPANGASRIVFCLSVLVRLSFSARGLRQWPSWRCPREKQHAKISDHKPGTGECELGASCWSDAISVAFWIKHLLLSPDRSCLRVRTPVNVLPFS